MATVPEVRSSVQVAEVPTAESQLEAAYERFDHMSDDPRVVAEVNRLEAAVLNSGYGDGLSPAEEALRDYTEAQEREASDRARLAREQREASRQPEPPRTLDERITEASSSVLRVTYGQLTRERFKTPQVMNRIHRIEAEMERRGESV